MSTAIHAFVREGVVTGTGLLPDWWIGDTQEKARRLTAEEFITHGWYPIQPVPEFDYKTHRLAPIAMDAWPVNEADVGPTHEVVPLTQEELDYNAAREREDLLNACDAEHARRVVEGKSFEVTGYGPVHPDGRIETQVVLLALKDTARDLKDAGITDPLLMFTDQHGDHYLTPDQMIQLANDGKVWMQRMHAANRTIKAMDPLPDFTDDSYWV